MQNTHVSEWGILEASVKGSKHSYNQDAKQTVQKPNYSLLAVADGHGSKAYFRSDQGAQFAVTIAMKEMGGVLDQLSTSTQPSEAMIKSMLDSIPANIVKEWRAQVNNHWNTTPPDQAEWALLNDLATLKEVGQHTLPTKPYGATLLSVLATPLFIFYSQIGDGDILVVTKNGHIYEPVPGDARLLANETTSLSTEHAEHDFRTVLDRIGDEQGKKHTPALILLATDGYRNSFNSEADFFKVALDIHNLLKQEGPEYVQQHLESWLQTTTEQGSGDDITVVLLWNKHLLQPEILTQDPSQTSEEEKLVLSSEETESPQQKRQEEQVNAPPNSPSTSDKLLFGNASFRRPSKKTGTGLESLFHEDFKDHKADKRRTFIVSQEPGAGNYTSITEALKYIPDGGSIIVAPGVYQERLNIERDVRIIAEEPGKVVITSPVPCIRCHASYAQINGIHISGQSQPDIYNQPAISLEAGRSEFIACHVTSKSRLIVGVAGQKTASFFSRCLIHDSYETGIWLNQSAKCTITQCTFRNNQQMHIYLEEASKLDCWNSTFSISNKHGLFVGKNCRLLLDTCTIEKYAGNGINFSWNYEAILKNCHIQEGHNTGLFLLGGHCLMEGGAITEQQKHASHIEQGSMLLLKRATIQHTNPDTWALVALQQSTMHLEKCEFVGPETRWYSSDANSQVHIHDDMASSPQY